MIGQLMLEYVCLEDRSNVSVEHEGVVLQCFDKKCVAKRIIVTKEYKLKDVTCPHCNAKYKVRFFKNGKVSMRIGSR